MKKSLPVLLLLLALTACGGQSLPEPPEPEGDICVLAEPAPPARDGLYISTEREVYDPSLTTFTCFVYNHTDETVEFGEDYRIQRLAADGSWADLTPREDWGFTAIGYILPPGGEMALTCTLDRYEEPPKPGGYRLWKSLGGREYPALFDLGESPYTLETPYGFGPLEDLPESYRADTASKDCAVFTSSGVRNLENVEEFVRKSGLGVPCQLRTVEDRGDGDPVIKDVIYENGHFFRRARRSGKIGEQRLSYLVTDGGDLYLSNGADWAGGERRGDRRALLVPEGTAVELAAAVESLTAGRLERNTIRYQIWSDDGIWSAGLTDSPSEFSVSRHASGEGSWGGVYDLQSWDGPETSITDISWQGDGGLLLTCGTFDGGTSRLAFYPETERLTNLDFCSLPPVEEAAGA